MSVCSLQTQRQQILAHGPEVPAHPTHSLCSLQALAGPPVPTLFLQVPPPVQLTLWVCSSLRPVCFSFSHFVC